MGNIKSIPIVSKCLANVTNNLPQFHMQILVTYNKTIYLIAYRFYLVYVHVLT